MPQRCAIVRPPNDHRRPSRRRLRAANTPPYWARSEAPRCNALRPVILAISAALKHSHNVWARPLPMCSRRRSLESAIAQRVCDGRPKRRKAALKLGEAYTFGPASMKKHLLCQRPHDGRAE
jgi:hypothetical protein